MKAFLLIAVALSLFSNIAIAAAGFTARELVELAANRSPQLRALSFEMDAANQLVLQAGHWKNPELAIEGEKKEEPNGDTNFTGIGFSQEIERPGRIRARKEAMRARASVLNADRETQDLEFRGRILGLIYEYKIANEKSIHAKERLERFKTVNQFLRSRTFASPQKRTESMIVRSKLMVLNRELRELESNRAASWHRLNLYLGLKNEPALRAAWYEKPKAYSFSELEAKTEMQNPELKKRFAQVKAQEQELKLARLDSWPGLTLSAKFANGTGANPEKNYGLGISFPLPLFDGSNGHIGSAQALVSAESARLDWTKDSVKQELRSAFEHYTAAAKSIEELAVRQINEIEKEMNGIDGGFKRGQVDLITYLEADSQHTETLNAVFESQTDYVAALTGLLLLVGEAPQPLEN